MTVRSSRHPTSQPKGNSDFECYLVQRHGLLPCPGDLSLSQVPTASTPVTACLHAVIRALQEEEEGLIPRDPRVAGEGEAELANTGLDTRTTVT